MTKRLYLAGPMRGIKDFNFPTFLRVGAILEDDGYEVFNPAQHDVDTYGIDAFRSETGDLADITVSFDLRLSLGNDLEYICAEADAVAVLDGWQNSSGAKAEVAAGLALGLPIFRVIESTYHGIDAVDLDRIRPSLTARTVDPEIAR